MVKKERRYLPLYKTLPKDVQELKTRVLKLLKLGWCQAAIATDRLGNTVYYSDPNAIAVCLTGAFCRATTEIGWNDPVVREIVKDFSCKIERILVEKYKRELEIVEFNDDPKIRKKDVIKVVEAVEV